MKKIIKYFSIVLFVVCCASGVSGEWDGTFYVDVQEGEVDCGDINNWTGTVAINTTIDVDNAGWHGYTTYTFNLDADTPGSVSANVIAAYNTEPPSEFCYGSDGDSWTSTPNPTVVNLYIETD